MNLNNNQPDYPRNSINKQKSSGNIPEREIAVYTTLAILLMMRKKLGLEAMLEYVETYTRTVEKSNPKFKAAVRQALSLMSVEKMYRDVRDETKK